jgi:hypothetical protein
MSTVNELKECLQKRSQSDWWHCPGIYFEEGREGGREETMKNFMIACIKAKR